MLLTLSLLAGAGALAYALYRLLKHHLDERDKRRQQQNQPQQGKDKGAQKAPAQVEKPPAEKKRQGEESGKQQGINRRDQERKEMIDRLVAQVEFTRDTNVRGPTRLERSMVPTDDISVERMEDVPDAVHQLPSAHTLDDNIYYAQLATKQLPVAAFARRVPVMDPAAKGRHNVLLVLQDISGSMKENGRAAWAVALNRSLLERCRQKSALYVLIRFDGGPREPVVCDSSESYAKVMSELPYLLNPDGGTSIPNALNAGIAFLSKGNYAIKRILLATDGEDNFDAAPVAEQLTAGEIALDTVVIEGENPSLRSLSRHYSVLHS